MGIVTEAVRCRAVDSWRYGMGSYRCAGSIPVLLLQSVINKGTTGEIVSVRRGFARNYLFPKKMAVYATAVNKEKYSSILKAPATKSMNKA